MSSKWKFSSTKLPFWWHLSIDVFQHLSIPFDDTNIDTRYRKVSCIVYKALFGTLVSIRSHDISMIELWVSWIEKCEKYSKTIIDWNRGRLSLSKNWYSVWLRESERGIAVGLRLSTRRQFRDHCTHKWQVKISLDLYFSFDLIAQRLELLSEMSIQRRCMTKSLLYSYMYEIVFNKHSLAGFQYTLSNLPARRSQYKILVPSRVVASMGKGGGAIAPTDLGVAPQIGTAPRTAVRRPPPDWFCPYHRLNPAFVNGAIQSKKFNKIKKSVKVY